MKVAKKTASSRGDSTTNANLAGIDILVQHPLERYLEGLGFRSIGRFLKCSHVAVYNWIKAFGAAADEIRSEERQQ